MPDKSSGSTGKNGKKKKGRWGFKAMGSSLNAVAMAGQRLKSKLQRGRKMDAMSSEFTALNESCKESRKLVGSIATKTEALRRAGDAFSAALHEYAELLVGLAQHKDRQAELGPQFSAMFCKSQITQAAMFDAQLSKTVALATEPMPALQELLATAKSEKALAYEALHHKSLTTSSASKGQLKGQLAYDAAALEFSNRQRASINALDAVKHEVELYVLDLLTGIAKVQGETATKSAAASATAADAAHAVSELVQGERAEWLAEVESRTHELASSQTVALAMGSSTGGHVSEEKRRDLFSAMTAGMDPPAVLRPADGEAVIQTVLHVLNVRSGVPGTLVVTNYRTRFFPYYKPTVTTPAPAAVDMQGRRLSYFDDSTADCNLALSVPHLAVSRAEAVEESNLLALWCHDLRQIRFGFSFAAQSAAGVLAAVLPLLWPETPERVFAFAGRRGSVSSDGATVRPSSNRMLFGQQVAKDGWELYHPEAECQRLTKDTALDGAFRVSSVNKDFAVCATYPAFIMVPNMVTDALIEAAAPFRSKSRFPAVVWMHKGAILGRCSQPRAGVFGSRSSKDERLASLLCSRDPYVGGKYLGKDLIGKRLAICDARPYVNAVGNKGKGGGVESISGYTDAHLEYLGIDNIHVVRGALATLRKRVREASVDSKTNREHLLRMSWKPHAAGVHAGRGSRPMSMAVSLATSRRLSGRPMSMAVGGSRVSPRAGRSPAAATAKTDDHLAASFASRRRAVSSPSGRSSRSLGRATSLRGFGDSDSLSPSALDARLALGNGLSNGAGADVSVVPEHRHNGAVSSQGGSSVENAASSGSEGASCLSAPEVGAPAGVSGAEAAMCDAEDAAGAGEGAGEGAGVAGAGAGVAGVGVSLRSMDEDEDGTDPTVAALLEDDIAVDLDFGTVRDSDKDAHVARINKKVVEGGMPEWLKLVSIVLAGSIRVAKLLHNGVSVLVHCSDGWDRTAQLSALAQLMLDPNPRTLRGFAVLVEKEWTSFGHQFARRSGTQIVGSARANVGDRQRSPVFLQFLDCTWQLMSQFPTHFEFTETLLRAIHDHVYSGRFGTFLFDCQRQRDAAGTSVKTPSFWSHVLSHPDRYLNPDYVRPKTAVDVGKFGIRASHKLAEVILPRVDEGGLKLWPAYAERWLGLGQQGGVHV